MDIRQALLGLTGAPHMIALRQGGPVLVLSPRGGVLDVRNGKPRHAVMRLLDYTAIDWQVLSPDQVAELVAKMSGANGAG
jgi:hypothetical protein